MRIMSCWPGGGSESSATGGKEAMLGKSEDNLSQTEMAKPLDETGGANSSSAGNGGNDDDEEADEDEDGEM